MKLIVVLSLFAATNAIDVSPMLCEVVQDGGLLSDTGKSCNKLRQENKGVCATGETRPVDIKFTSLSICGANDEINGETSFFKLTGPAIKNIYGSAQEFKWSDLTTATQGPFCTKKTLDLQVDKCATHFNGQLVANRESSSDTAFKFDRYMLRNCPLSTNIECKTPSGKPCGQLNDNNCESGTFKYKFCYRTSSQDHDIKIRKNYSAQNRPPTCVSPFTSYFCQESHAYINGSVGNGDFIGEGFPQRMNLGPTSGFFQKCQVVDVDVPASTCDKESLPPAYMNVVGYVSNAIGEGAVPKSEFKNCFHSSNFNMGESDNADAPPEGGEDCDSTTKSPSSKTKSPSSKGTKSPSSKGTKSPSSKGVKKCKGGTKRKKLRARHF